jgi:hypothetical protein
LADRLRRHDRRLRRFSAPRPRLITSIYCTVRPVGGAGAGGVGAEMWRHGVELEVETDVAPTS